MGDLTTLVENLRSKSIIGWKDAINENFSTSEGEKYIAKIQALSSKLNADIYGLVDQSTNIIYDIFPDVLPSTATHLWSLAKEKNLVYQVGRGKGKCLILFDLTITEEAPPVPTIASNDGVELAKALRELVGHYLADLEHMRGLLIVKEKLLNDKDEIIRSLQNQLNVHYKTTWS